MTPGKAKTAESDDWNRNTWNAESTVNTIRGSGDMITIVNTELDSNGKTFHASVHKDLLCYYSPYYTAALKGGFSEAKRDTITMDLPSESMADLVSWLYSGTIISEDEIDLMELYVFADEKMMLALRRSIMSRIIQLLDLGFPMEAEEAMPYVKRIPQNSGLFRYLVDFWVCVWSQTDAKFKMATLDEKKRIPRLFFYQALEKLGDLVKKGDQKRLITATLQTPCNFHEHLNYYEWKETCGSQDPPSKNAIARPDDTYYKSL